KALPVAADSGQIGGDTSVEHMVLAEAGEASLVWCDCGFAADDEAATGIITVAEGPVSEKGECVLIDTPGASTISSVAAYFGIPESATRKSILLIDGEGRGVLAIIPGDHELCEVKAEHAFGEYHMMSDEELESFGLFKGFIGPVGAPDGLRIVADPSLKASEHWLVGGNKPDTHWIDARLGRDFEIDEWIDLATIHEGDGCPICGKPLHAARGIEVSHVFQLGTKYSKALGATFMDETGVEKPLIMGCYGVGVSRTLAAAVEQSHDENGIIWPVSIAPYEAAVIPLDVDDDLVWPAAERVANELAEAGIEVVVDDRSERPGVKFADNDLMGFPFQLVFGKRAVAKGNCELKIRATGERSELPIEEAAATVAELVKAGRL
ncbi:MAG: proline--tRNA ligase, partial [Atopobiaceae bacterium]|nr:proline--tRNA ligase [Atopobiaceae bacterium]